MWGNLFKLYKLVLFFWQKTIVNDKFWSQFIYPALGRWALHSIFFFWSKILSFTMRKYIPTKHLPTACSLLLLCTVVCSAAMFVFLTNSFHLINHSYPRFVFINVVPFPGIELGSTTPIGNQSLQTWCLLMWGSSGERCSSWRPLSMVMTCGQT